MNVRLKFYVVFSFLCGLGLIIFGLQYGHVSMLSILDVLSGDKVLTELNQTKQTEKAVAPIYYLDDNRTYMSISIYHDDINTLLSLLLKDKTQLQIKSIKSKLPPLTKKRQIHWDTHLYSEPSSKDNLNKDKDGNITGGFSFDVSVRMLTFILESINQNDLNTILMENRLFTQSWNNRVQSKSVIFEFNSKGKLEKVLRR
jgi:hypothetical protein